MCARTLQRRRFDHVTTIDAPDDPSPLLCPSAAGIPCPDTDNVGDPVGGERTPSCLDAAAASGKPPYGDDVMITSHGDAEELQAHRVPGNPPDLDPDVTQSGGPGDDPVTSCGGRNRQTSLDFCDGVENRRPAVLNEIDGKPRCEAVKPTRGTTSVGGRDGAKSGRVCDDCRAGILRRTATTSGERTQRWNSPASQQPTARQQRTTRSAGRQSQGSVGDRTRSNFEDRRSGGSETQNGASSNRQRRKQPRRRDNRPDSSPTAAENCATEPAAAASGRRDDVTSGHVTRRSLSAKTASTATAVPGRRCQSSDDRRQRKNLSVADHDLTQAPFRRKCCCATKNSQGQSQGQQVSSGGQTGSSSRLSERRALPDVVSKPWAKTLRDYGGGDKSPSPVRSRRSTPESVNCTRSSTRPTRTGSEVSGGQDLPANRRPAPPSQTKRPTRADLGKTKSDSTLIQRRLDNKISSAGALSIPPSSSLGAVTPRRAMNGVMLRLCTYKTVG